MWKRRLLSLPAALCALVLLGGAEGLDSDELACEQAVKHLDDCCPPDTPATRFDCYAGRGCDHRVPDLSSSQSASILASSCQELVGDDVCDKLQPQPQPPDPPFELPE